MNTGVGGTKPHKLMVTLLELTGTAMIIIIVKAVNKARDWITPHIRVVAGNKSTNTETKLQAEATFFVQSAGVTQGKTGTTTFGKTDGSGEAVVGVAGQGAMGRIAAGSLELANVDFAQQAAAIGMAKQNYEANFAAFKAMDKLTESAIGLVR